MTYLGMRYYVEIYTIVHILWGQAWKKSFSGKKRKLLTFHVQYLWRVVHYDITVTWPEVQNGSADTAGSQVSIIHNFRILYPTLLKFSLVCLNKVQLYYKSSFSIMVAFPFNRGGRSSLGLTRVIVLWLRKRKVAFTVASNRGPLAVFPPNR